MNNAWGLQEYLTSKAPLRNRQSLADLAAASPKDAKALIRNTLREHMGGTPMRGSPQLASMPVLKRMAQQPAERQSLTAAMHANKLGDAGSRVLKPFLRAARKLGARLKKLPGGFKI